MAASSFSPDAHGQVILRALSELDTYLSTDAKVLLLTTPSQRWVKEVKDALGSRSVQVFDQAKVHVPRATVDAAKKAAASFGPTALLTVGGGAATGLGKALRVEGVDAALVSVATTYSGSERTRIWGITKEHEGAREKETGRDEKAKPDAIVHAPELVASLPKTVAIQSLVNALAHPISALSAGIDDEKLAKDAHEAITKLVFAIRQAIRHHAQADVRLEALAAVRLSGRVLDTAKMGAHHRLAHALGGSLDLDHAALHALLLPHSIAALAQQAPEAFERMQQAARTPNLAAFIHDALKRVDAPTRLKEQDVTLDAAKRATESLDLPPHIVLDTWRGIRPVPALERVRTGDETADVYDVVDPAPKTVVLAIHGRGSNAERAIEMVREAVGHRPDVAVVAPQSPSDAWVDLPYTAEAAELAAPLATAREQVATTLRSAAERFASARIVLFGFSQGACLLLDLVANDAVPELQARVDAVFAIAGALPPRLHSLDGDAVPATFEGKRVHLSLAHDDKWVRAEDVEKTAAAFERAGAIVTSRLRPGSDHRVTQFDRHLMRQAIGDLPAAAHGFGGHHRGEALAGAVPGRQNTPRHAPYGLHSEQVSGTGFVAPRRENLRSWLYRIRPSAQHTRFSPVDHPRVSHDFEIQSSPNLSAWSQIVDDSEGPQDFVAGLTTLGGAGNPALRRGFALHGYRATADMEDHAFTNADGDLLVLPQQGRLIALTEFGALEVEPGEVLLLPRGLRVSILVPDGEAQGYAAEIFAGHFQLPERGPIGANGLVDERHFRGPTPYYEDRLAPGFRMTHKFGGALSEATQDHSPFDVVGWHGAYLPLAYRFSAFSPVSNTAFDHTDPSAFTVLSAALDEEGANALDLVVFPARWDPTEHTFKPPYFHRNVTTEINGIIEDPSLNAPFTTGMVFVTPSMTPHGVRAGAVERFLAKSDEAADRPTKSSSKSLWFQFETALHFHRTEWAKRTDLAKEDWPDVWGEYGVHFDPRRLRPRKTTSER